MSEHPEMDIRRLLTEYRDGDEMGWAAEFAWLRTFHYRAIANLTVDIARNGIREPISLGYDGRVWDGHHRLCVAEALDWRTVPVLQMQPEPGDGVTPDEGATP